MLSKKNLFFVFIIAFFVIFYRFNQIPKHLAFDEGEFARLALSLDAKPYTPYSPLATGHSTLYFYIILFSFKLLGINNFALRLPSAIFGILSVVVFYLITRKKLKSAFFLTLIFLTSRWFLNFSRFSFETTFLLFLELLSIYFLFKKNLFLSGLFAGLAFNSYTPGRIFFLLPLFFIVLMSNLSFMVKKALFFLIPFLIIITPLTTYLLIHKDTRIEQQFFLKNTELSNQKKTEFLLQNIQSTALMFNFKGDMNGRHNYPGKPALNPILGLLFIFGLALAIRNYKNIHNRFFLLYFFLSLLPALLTYPWENPNMLRTFTVLPSVVYFIGQAINLIPRKKWGKIVVFSLIVFSSLYEIRTYFKYQSAVFNQSFELKKQLPEALKEINQYEKN